MRILWTNCIRCSFISNLKLSIWHWSYADIIPLESPFKYKFKTVVDSCIQSKVMIFHDFMPEVCNDTHIQKVATHVVKAFVFLLEWAWKTPMSFWLSSYLLWTYKINNQLIGVCIWNGELVAARLSYGLVWVRHIVVRYQHVSMSVILYTQVVIA